jgi:hypothetical protein
VSHVLWGVIKVNATEREKLKRKKDWFEVTKFFSFRKSCVCIKEQGVDRLYSFASSAAVRKYMH